MPAVTVVQLIAQARSWIGVPFHHQGRSRAGVDCIGLYESVLRELGALPEDYREATNYGRRPTAELDAGLGRWCVRVDVPIPGALLAIRWPQMRGISHVALFTGMTIIHAYRHHGVHEHAYGGQWVKWTAGAWKLPGVIYPGAENP